MMSGGSAVDAPPRDTEKRGFSMPNQYTPIAERLWSKVVPAGTCWEWTGSKCHGHGRFRLNGRDFYVHRFAYRQLVGPIPPGLTIDHLCRNRACVNPAHMEAVPNRTNILRGIGYSAQNARKTHCPRGHAYVGANVRCSNGKRYCKRCDQLRHLTPTEALEQRGESHG